MNSRMRRYLSVALCLLTCAGCAHRHKKNTPPVHSVVGTVALVNEAGRFVLIDAASSFPMQDGIALKTFSNGKETGVLTLSPERKPPFVIGDIVGGNPQKGDQVMQ